MNMAAWKFFHKKKAMWLQHTDLSQKSTGKLWIKEQIDGVF